MGDGVTLFLLGPLEVWAGGQRVAVGGARAEKLLAALALEAGHAVPVDRLVDVLWDHDPPATAARQVRNIAAGLRRLLDAELVADGPGYRLANVRIDAQEFADHLRNARAAPDPGATVGELRRALALWRGPALAGIGSRVLAAAAVELDERRLSTLEECVELELGLGRHRELVGELSALVAAHPLRERFTAHLMLALYRCGRVGDALAAYRDLRDRLAAELGVDTSPELARLEAAILRVDPALDPPSAAAGWRGPKSHLTVLVGRGRERAEVGALTRRHRLVTLVGVGGVGKSTLSLAVAEDFAGEVAVVPLAGARAGEVVVTIGSVLGISGTSTEEVAQECERHLASRTLLLVLDNCEHVTAECADAARRLLAHAPGLTVLTASRRPLGVAEEIVYTLDGLGEDAAAALFARRATQAKPGVALDTRDVARICARLDGLPLALELAATRLRALPLRELAERLDQNLGLLSAGQVGADPRHVTLTAAIEWSYRLLDPLEQRLLARLSVFRAGFTAHEAEEICAGPPLSRDRVLPTLAALVDHSVVQPCPSESPRYRLLAAVREFAAGRLDESDPVADRHLDHRLAQFRALAERPTLQDVAMAGIAVWPGPDNLRAALAHGFASGRQVDALELTGLLFVHWMVRAVHHVEGDRWLRAGWPYLDQCPPRVRRAVGVARAVIDLDRGELIRTRALLRPFAGERDVEDARVQGELLSMLTIAELRTLNPAALETGAEFLAGYRDSPDADQVALAVHSLAYALVTWGRYDEAAGLCDEFADRVESAGPSYAGRFLSTRTRAEYGRGDVERARHFAALTEKTFAAAGQYAHQSVLHRALVHGALVEGDARDAAARALTLLHALYPPSMDLAAEFSVLLAEAHRRAGEPEAALPLLSTGLTHGGEDYLAMLPGVLTTALLAADLGDHETHQALLTDWDDLRRGLGLPVALGFETVAELDLSGGTPSTSWHQEPLADLVHRASSWAAKMTP